MKKFVVYQAVMLALAVCGCTKKEITAPVDPSQKFRIGVSVPVEGYESKVTDTGDESAVNRLQVFAFKENGDIDAWNVASSDNLVLECTTLGYHDIVAIANESVIRDVFSISDLQEKTTHLQHSEIGSFVMTGMKKVFISSSSDISVPVSRLVARVSIEKIVCDFISEEYRDADFILKAIYLTNAPGDASYMLPDCMPVYWYNCMERQSLLTGFLDSGDLSVSVTAAEPYAVAHHFYCYPNPVTEDSFAGDWSPRKTRLVVEAELGGKTYYYPVTMPVIEANHKYTITELRITKPGYLSPEMEMPADDKTASFSIVVEDWSEGFSGPFEI